MNANTAVAILIDENGREGAIHTRGGAGMVDILPTGPRSGKGFRMVVLDGERTCLILGHPSIRCFQARRT